MANANKKQNESKDETKGQDAQSGQPPKPRAIVTMATDGTTVSSPVRTTRELYMEQIRNEDS